MIQTDKVIICVSPSGTFQGKEANPALPIQPDEIVEEVVKCWNEGAAIVHIHTRDREGVPCNDPEVFAEIDGKLRARGCDIIIQHSTAQAVRAGGVIADGMKSLDPGPEMASLGMGLSAFSWQDSDYFFEVNRKFIHYWAGVMKEKGIKPEMEVYNPAQMYDVQQLIANDLLDKPYWMSFVLSMHRLNQGTIWYSPKVLLDCVDMVPAEGMFSTIGIGPDELPATTMSILLGGHLRVGFEDNVYYSKGRLAESNAELVARAARIATELGRPPASPAEARQYLGLPVFAQVG